MYAKNNSWELGSLFPLILSCMSVVVWKHMFLYRVNSIYAIANMAIKKMLLQFVYSWVCHSNFTKLKSCHHRHIFHLPPHLHVGPIRQIHLLPLSAPLLVFPFFSYLCPSLFRTPFIYEIWFRIRLGIWWDLPSLINYY